MRVADLKPWRAFVIETRWSPDVAAVELQKRMDAPRFFSSRGDAPFAGRAIGDGRTFRFSRQISYRNSSLPVIHAVVEPSHREGARIRVTMRPHLFTTVFMFVWISGATIGALQALYRMIADGNWGGLVVILFPLAGVAFLTVPFALEARKAEHLLREIYASAPALPMPVDTGVAYR